MFTFAKSTHAILIFPRGRVPSYRPEIMNVFKNKCMSFTSREVLKSTLHTSSKNTRHGVVKIK